MISVCVPAIQFALNRRSRGPAARLVQMRVCPTRTRICGTILRQLAGFAVVDAAPGETVEAVIELPLRAFQRWGESGWELRTGLYELQAAHDSADVRATLSLEVPPRK